MRSIRAIVVDPAVAGRFIIKEVEAPQPGPSEALVRVEAISLNQSFHWTSCFLDRLVSVCAQLLAAAAQAGEISANIDAYQLMRGIGNLCVGADNDPRYSWSPAA